MPLDANIPLSVATPKFNNPFEQLRKWQDDDQQRQLMQQQINSGQALEQQRREMAAEQEKKRREGEAVAQAFQQATTADGKIDRGKLTSLLSAQGLGASAPVILKGLDEAEEATSKAELARQNIDKGRREAEAAEEAYRKNVAAKILAANFDPGIIKTQFGAAKAYGHDVSEFEQAAQNPEQFKSYITNLVRGPQQPITLAPGAKRIGPDGQVLAENPARAANVEQKTVLLNGRPAMVNFHPDTGKSTLPSGEDVSDRISPVPPQSAVTVNQTGDDAKSIAEAIARGEQPPDVTGLYRLAGPVRSELAKMGYDMTKANLDWKATQRHVQTLNGQQQTRFRQAIDTALHSVDVIDTLADQWKGSGFPLLNKANLALAKQGALGPQAASLATQLDGQITDVTSELGQVFMGGNSPTDHALELAGKNLRADWSDKVLRDMTKLARTNLQIRKNSVENVGVAGARTDNQYAPQQSAPAQAPSQGGMVLMTAPDGKKYQVPADKVASAKAQGWK